VANQDVKRLQLPPFAGSGDDWGGSMPLNHSYPEAIVLDARAIQFVVPTFLLRVRTFIDWHRAEGRDVKVIPPSRAGVRSYLPSAKKNADLATDVAAMTVDGGILLYGIREDSDGRPTIPSPIPLAGAAERVDQIVSSSISEAPYIEIIGHPCADVETAARDVS
jgi:hypothetical protein